MDMIDRYKKWSLTHTNESDSDSDASGSNNGNDDNSGQDDSDWNLTVKGKDKLMRIPEFGYKISFNVKN